jgi:riboflavin kinase / FMN adenylyltransferase
MQCLASVDELPADVPLVLTLGVFDGVHRGHQRVLHETVRAAGSADAKAVAVTFDPHPAQVLRGEPPPLLCHPAERLALFERAGIDIAVVQRFDREFAAQTAEQFLRRVSGGRQLRGLVMTSETAFGRDRAGTLASVEELSTRLGFSVMHCPDVSLAGERISSTRLRQLLGEGRLAQVRRLLGRRYAVVGEVVPGDRRGRDLGYPTANLRFEQPVALPSDGIYAVRVSWGGPDVLAPDRRADGVAALGVRPTFGGGQRTLEVYIFDFDGDLYGEQLRVEFVRRQRAEKEFRSVAALITQMGRDAERARQILRSSA